MDFRVKISSLLKLNFNMRELGCDLSYERSLMLLTLVKKASSLPSQTSNNFDDICLVSHTRSFESIDTVSRFA